MFFTNPGLFLFCFRAFLIATSISVSISTLQFEKSTDVVLGILTRGRRMVAADETIEHTGYVLSKCFAQFPWSDEKNSGQWRFSMSFAS